MYTLMLAALFAQATPPPWSAYITLVDFEGDGEPERVIVEPWYEGQSEDPDADYGRVSIERDNGDGTATLYDFYGTTEGDTLGGSNHEVVNRPLQGGEALLLSTENGCSVVLYWDGMWDTLPYTMKYVNCQ